MSEVQKILAPAGATVRRARPRPVCATSPAEPPASGHTAPVFFFFSNRLGCLPSILLSLAVTALLLLLLGVL
ncbi:MAG: hypothetical protein ACLGIG_08105 [Actinomycetes bacterium]